MQGRVLELRGHKPSLCFFSPFYSHLQSVHVDFPTDMRCKYFSILMEKSCNPNSGPGNVAIPVFNILGSHSVDPCLTTYGACTIRGLLDRSSLHKTHTVQTVNKMHCLSTREREREREKERENMTLCLLLGEISHFNLGPL